MRWFLCSAALLAVTVSSAKADEKVVAEPQQTRRAAITIVNGTKAPLLCGALLAHWFKVEFGTPRAGETLTVPLEINPLDETVYVRNDRNRAMVIEDLYCQQAQASWEAADHMHFRRLALSALRKPMHINCTQDQSQRLHCEADDHH